MKRRFVPPIAAGGSAAGGGVAGVGGRGGAAGAAGGVHRPFKLPTLVKPAPAAPTPANPPAASPGLEDSAEQQSSPLLPLPRLPPAPPPSQAATPKNRGLRARKRTASAGALHADPVAAVEGNLPPSVEAAAEARFGMEEGAGDLGAAPIKEPACAAQPEQQPPLPQADQQTPTAAAPAGLPPAAQPADTASMDSEQHPPAPQAAQQRPAAPTSPPAADLPPAVAAEPTTAAATAVVPPGVAGAGPLGWRVLRLPVLDSLPPCPAPAPSMPPAAQLFSRLPQLPMAGHALLQLGSPLLGDLGPIAEQLESSALPQPLPAHPTAGGMQAVTSQQVMRGLLSAHPLPLSRCTQLLPAQAPPQKLHIGRGHPGCSIKQVGVRAEDEGGRSKMQTPAPAGPSVAAAPPLAPPRGRATEWHAKVRAAKAVEPPGQKLQQPAALGRQASVAPSAAASAPAFQHFTAPPPLDVARVRRELGEAQRVPLSLLRRLVFA